MQEREHQHPTCQELGADLLRRRRAAQDARRAREACLEAQPWQEIRAKALAAKREAELTLAALDDIADGNPVQFKWGESWVDLVTIAQGTEFAWVSTSLRPKPVSHEWVAVGMDTEKGAVLYRRQGGAQ